MPHPLPEILGTKVVNEWIETAIQAAQTERQFVGRVDGFLVEDSQDTMSKQKNVVGSKADGEDEENDNRQFDGFFFLSRLGIAGQLAYDTDVAECRDTERKEEEDEHHAEEKGSPGCLGREHVFLQHVKTCGNPKFGNLKGQVRGHQWVQDTQHQPPHEEAANHSDGLLLPDLLEHHRPDNSKVAVNPNGHHGQDGAVHIGVEDEG